MHRSAALVLVGVLGLVTACTAHATSPSPAESAAPPTASASAAGSAEPSGGPTPASGGRHSDLELEGLLPTALGGVALIVESQTGTELATDSPAFDEFLSGLGRTRADFTIASAYSRGGLEAQVGAWRVREADADLLLPGFIAAVQASSTTPLSQAQELVAGRTVTRISDPGQLTQGPIWVYSRGDTLLFVQTTDPTLAAEAIGKLPP